MIKKLDKDSIKRLRDKGSGRIIKVWTDHFPYDEDKLKDNEEEKNRSR